MQAENPTPGVGSVPTTKNFFIGLFSILLFLYLTFAKVAPHSLNTAILQQFSGINFGLATTYALAYFLTLIFAGFVADRWGYQKTLAIALIASLISTYVASTATHLVVFTSALALLGFANALGLIGALKTGATVFQRHYFGFFAAVLFASLLIIYHLGLHQAIFKLLSDTAHLGLILSLFGVVCLLFILVISPAPLADQNTPNNLMHHAIIGNYKIWLIAVIFLLSQFFVNNFSLYGQVFLGQNSQLTSEQIANVLININHALIAGTIITGVLCSITARKHLLIVGGYLLAALCFLLFTYLPQLTYLTALALLCLTAFFLGTNVTCYALAYDHCPNTAQTGKLFSFIALMGLLGNVLLALFPIEMIISDSYKMNSYKTQSVSIANMAPFQVNKTFLTITALSLIIGAVLALLLRKTKGGQEAALS